MAPCPVHLCCSKTSCVSPRWAEDGAETLSLFPEPVLPIPTPRSKRASPPQEPFVYFPYFLATYFLVAALYPCSPNNSFTSPLLCWKEKTLTSQPRWWPSGRSRLLTLVGAWPGLSSPPRVAAGGPQGPVGAGVPSFSEPPQQVLSRAGGVSPKPGVSSLLPLGGKKNDKQYTHGQCRNLDNMEQ